jgi:hypothetical protein
MTLISLIVYLVILGLILYVVGLLPIDATIKRVIQIVVIVAVLLWLIEALGFMTGMGSLRIGR